MATQTRIYLVTDHADGGSFLVRAPHPAQAVRRITSNRYQASVATQEEIVEMFAIGAKVIDAGETTDEDPVVTENGQLDLLPGAPPEVQQWSPSVAPDPVGVPVLEAA